MSKTPAKRSLPDQDHRPPRMASAVLDSLGRAAGGLGQTEKDVSSVQVVRQLDGLAIADALSDGGVDGVHDHPSSTSLTLRQAHDASAAAPPAAAAALHVWIAPAHARTRAGPLPRPQPARAQDVDAARGGGLGGGAGPIQSGCSTAQSQPYNGSGSESVKNTGPGSNGSESRCPASEEEPESPSHGLLGSVMPMGSVVWLFGGELPVVARPLVPEGEAFLIQPLRAGKLQLAEEMLSRAYADDCALSIRYMVDVQHEAMSKQAIHYLNVGMWAEPKWWRPRWLVRLVRRVRRRVRRSRYWVWLFLTRLARGHR